MYKPRQSQRITGANTTINANDATTDLNHHHHQILIVINDANRLPVWLMNSANFSLSLTHIYLHQMHTTLTRHCDSDKTKADAHSHIHCDWDEHDRQIIFGFYNTTLLTTQAGQFIQGFASNSPDLKSIFLDQGIAQFHAKFVSEYGAYIFLLLTKFV